MADALKPSLVVVAVAAAFGSDRAANADLVRATSASTLTKNISVSAPSLMNEPVTIVATGTYRWTRNDGAYMGGEGVDTLVPSGFESSCVELGRPLPQGQELSYDVLAIGSAGYSDRQVTQLSRLWGTYRGMVNSPETSAAFQLSVWEIVHDDGADVASGAFVVNSLGDPRTTAQGWLNAINDAGFAGQTATLGVLVSGSHQNQLVVVPAPAGSVLLGAAGLASFRRRRR